MRLHFKAKLTFFSRKCQTFLTNYLMSDIILISDVTKLLTQIINAIDEGIQFNPDFFADCIAIFCNRVNRGWSITVRQFGLKHGDRVFVPV